MIGPDASMRSFGLKGVLLFLFLFQSHAVVAADGTGRKFSVAEALRVSPPYRETEIRYSRGLEKKAVVKLTESEWRQAFQRRYVYTIPETAVELYDYGKQRQTALGPTEVSAYVFGRIALARDTVGLLVAERGYYQGDTRIVIYPIEKSGESGVGLEVADWFADEDEEIIVSSRIINREQFEIQTNIRKIQYKEVDVLKPSKKREIIAKSDKGHVWWFDPKKGFVRK